MNGSILVNFSAVRYFKKNYKYMKYVFVNLKHNPVQYNSITILFIFRHKNLSALEQHKKFYD